MEKQRKNASSKYNFLLPAGIGIGISIGALIHNIGVGMAIGVAIGTILSLTGSHFEQRKIEKDHGAKEK